MWDSLTGVSVIEPIVHVTRVTSCSVSAVGDVAASGDAHGDVKIWQLDGTVVAEIGGLHSM